MIKWIRTSRLSRKKSLYAGGDTQSKAGRRCTEADGEAEKRYTVAHREAVPHGVRFQDSGRPGVGCAACADRVLDGPASGKKGSNGRNELDCIRGKGVRALIFRTALVGGREAGADRFSSTKVTRCANIFQVSGRSGVGCTDTAGRSGVGGAYTWCAYTRFRAVQV